MNIVIHIYPNVGESWAVTSPVAGISVPHHIILPVGRNPSTASEGTVIYGLLLDIGNIDRKVEILESRGLETDSKFIGVGGIAKTSDVDITLNNYDDFLDPDLFFGRTVKITVLSDGETSLNYNDEDCILTGYVSEVALQSSKELIFTIADSAIKRLHTPIGTEVKEDTIVPITYGVFDNVESLGVYKDDEILIDTEECKSISAVKVYDSSLDTFYSLDITPKMDPAGTKLQFYPVEDQDAMVSINELLADTRYLAIYNPFRRAYLLETTESLTKGDVYTYTVGATVVRIMFLLDKEGYQVFDDPYSHMYAQNNETTFPLPPATGTLTRYSGTGPETITYSFRSETLPRPLTYEADEYTEKVNYAESRDTLASQANRALLKIDSEIIQLANWVSDTVSEYNAYNYTAYRIIRGVNGTTATSHTMFKICSLVKDPDDTTKSLFSASENKQYLFGGLFKAERASGFSEYHDPEPSETSGSLSNYTVIGNPNNVGNSTGFSIQLIRAVDNKRNEDQMVFEIKLPSPGFEGIVQDMFFYGKVEFDFSLPFPAAAGEHNHMCFHIGKGGIKTPNLFNLANDPESIGYYKNDVSSVYVPGGLYYLPSNYPALHLSELTERSLYEGLPLLAISAESGSYYHFIAYEIWDRDLSIYNAPIRKWFDNTVAGRNPLKCFSLKNRGEQTKDGCIGNLSELGSAKYFLCCTSQAGAIRSDPVVQRINISDIGLYILFSCPLGSNDLWLNCQGRTTTSGIVITRPAYILQDLFYKEYGFSLVTAESSPNVNTTLNLTGPKQDFFNKYEAFCKMHGLIVSTNNLGNLIISHCFTDSYNSVTEITDAEILPENWTQSWSKADSLATKLILKYCYRKASEKFLNILESEIDNICLQEDKDVLLENQFIATEADANFLLTHFAEFLKRPIREINIEVLSGYRQIGTWYSLNTVLIPRTKDNIYLLVGTVDVLPVNREPYTKLTLLELVRPSAVSTAFSPDIIETSEGEINETNSSDTIIEF